MARGRNERTAAARRLPLADHGERRARGSETRDAAWGFAPYRGRRVARRAAANRAAARDRGGLGREEGSRAAAADDGDPGIGNPAAVYVDRADLKSDRVATK